MNDTMLPLAAWTDTEVLLFRSRIEEHILDVERHGEALKVAFDAWDALGRPGVEWTELHTVLVMLRAQLSIARLMAIRFERERPSMEDAQAFLECVRRIGATSIEWTGRLDAVRHAVEASNG